MARQQVIQINCDRCTRVEHRPLSEMPKTGEPVFVGQFMGQKIVYDDLCSGCEEIVKIRWNDIQRELQQKSPIRQRKEPSELKPPLQKKP